MQTDEQKQSATTPTATGCDKFVTICESCHHHFREGNTCPRCGHEHPPVGSDFEKPPNTEADEPQQQTPTPPTGGILYPPGVLNQAHLALVEAEEWIHSRAPADTRDRITQAKTALAEAMPNAEAAGANPTEAAGPPTYAQGWTDALGAHIKAEESAAEAAGKHDWDLGTIRLAVFPGGKPPLQILATHTNGMQTTEFILAYTYAEQDENALRELVRLARLGMEHQGVAAEAAGITKHPSCAEALPGPLWRAVTDVIGALEETITGPAFNLAGRKELAGKLCDALCAERDRILTEAAGDEWRTCDNNHAPVKWLADDRPCPACAMNAAAEAAAVGRAAVDKYNAAIDKENAAIDAEAAEAEQQAAVSGKPEAWRCECGQTQHARIGICLTCGQHNPDCTCEFCTTAVPPAEAEGGVVCVYCRHRRPATEGKCPSCGLTSADAEADEADDQAASMEIEAAEAEVIDAHLP